MNVAPEMVRATRHDWDTDDLAFLYMEEEVGRFDWRNNWMKIKARGNVQTEVQAWLDDIHVQHDPAAIINCLDRMVEHRTGCWM